MSSAEECNEINPSLEQYCVTLRAATELLTGTIRAEVPSENFGPAAAAARDFLVRAFKACPIPGDASPDLRTSMGN